ncbi:MAG: SH3 domain-containing protein [Oscillospiraceae bacterium]|nr:SH3 domain-containing protein [Oscillospiraceae bacterium]
MKYWVYETYVGKKSATIHKSTCIYCRNISEQITYNDNEAKGIWYGEFDTCNKAIEFANLFKDYHIIKCKTCKPGYIEKNRLRDSKKSKDKIIKENIIQEIVNNKSKNPLFDKNDELIYVEKGEISLSDVEFRKLKEKFPNIYLDSERLILPGIKFSDIQREFPELTIDDLTSMYKEVLFVNAQNDHSKLNEVPISKNTSKEINEVPISENTSKEINEVLINNENTSKDINELSKIGTIRVDNKILSMKPSTDTWKLDVKPVDITIPKVSLDGIKIISPKIDRINKIEEKIHHDVDLVTVDVPNLDILKVDVPKVDIHNVDIPKADVPKVDEVKVEVPNLNFEPVNIVVPQVKLDKIKVEHPKINLNSIKLKRPEVKGKKLHIKVVPKHSLLNQDLDDKEERIFIEPKIPKIAEEVKIEDKYKKLKLHEPYFNSDKLVLLREKFKELKEKFRDLSDDESMIDLDEDEKDQELKIETKNNKLLSNDPYQFTYKDLDLILPNLSSEESKVNLPDTVLDSNEDKIIKLNDLKLKTPNLLLDSLKSKFQPKNIKDNIIDFSENLEKTKIMPTIKGEEYFEETKVLPILKNQEGFEEIKPITKLKPLDVEINEPKIKIPKFTLKDLRLKFPSLSIDALKAKFPDADFSEDIALKSPDLNIEPLAMETKEPRIKVPIVTLNDLRLKFPNLSIDALKAKFPDADFSEDIALKSPDLNIKPLDTEIKEPKVKIPTIKFSKFTLKDLRSKFPDLSMDALKAKFPDADFGEDIDDLESEYDIEPIVKPTIKVPKLTVKDLRLKFPNLSIDALKAKFPDADFNAGSDSTLDELDIEPVDIRINEPKVGPPKLTLKDLRLRFPSLTTDELREKFPNADFSDDIEARFPEINLKDPEISILNHGQEEINNIESVNSKIIENDVYFKKTIDLPTVRLNKQDIPKTKIDFSDTGVKEKSEDIKFENLKAKLPDIYTNGETLFLPGISLNDIKNKIPNIALEELRAKYPSIKFNATKIDFPTLKNNYPDAYMDENSLILPGLNFKDLLRKFPGLTMNELKANYQDIVFDADEITFDNLKSKFPNIYMENNTLVLPHLIFRDLRAKFPHLTMDALREKFPDIVFDAESTVITRPKAVKSKKRSGLLWLLLAVVGLLLLLFLISWLLKACSNSNQGIGIINTTTNTTQVQATTQEVPSGITFQDIKQQFPDAYMDGNQLVVPSVNFEGLKAKFPDVTMDQLNNIFIGGVRFDNNNIDFDTIKAKIPDAVLDGNKLMLPKTSFDGFKILFPNVTIDQLNAKFSGGVDFGLDDIDPDKIKAKFPDIIQEADKITFPSENFDDFKTEFPSITIDQLNAKFPGGVIFGKDEIVISNINTQVPNVTDQPSNAQVPNVTDQPNNAQVPNVTNKPNNAQVPNVTYQPSNNLPNNNDGITFDKIKAQFPDAELNGNTLILPNADFNDLKAKFPSLTMDQLNAKFDEVQFNKIGNINFVKVAMFTTTDYLNFRLSPSLNNAPVEVIPPGTKITAVGQTGDWIRIIYNKKVGYSSTSFLNQNSSWVTSLMPEPESEVDGLITKVLNNNITINNQTLSFASDAKVEILSNGNLTNGNIDDSLVNGVGVASLNSSGQIDYIIVQK